MHRGMKVKVEENVVLKEGVVFDQGSFTWRGEGQGWRKSGLKRGVFFD